mmetsp:Transcript_19949/g.22194  ORF Transcript_19949/g.22194 Transcript_19949/m.22194 type:complete len:152 (+) Transcript_19949:98-553(+)
MGFITTMLFDGALLSIGCAGLRRWVHLSLRGWIEPKLVNPYLQIGAKGFFDGGEFLLEKGITFAQSAKSQSVTQNIAKTGAFTGASNASGAFSAANTANAARQSTLVIKHVHLRRAPKKRRKRVSKKSTKINTKPKDTAKSKVEDEDLSNF